MGEVREWTVRTMEAEEVHGLIRKIVPYDSPLSARVHRLVFVLVKSSRNYLITIHDQSADSSLKKLTDDECNIIIKAVNFHKNTDAWSVPYMLAIFTKYYRQKPFTDKSWLFMSKYLQLILLIVERRDDHFKKINILGMRIRMALQSTPQKTIIEELINIYAASNNVNEDFDNLVSYEQERKLKEKNGLVENIKLANKIREIRFAYKVVIEDIDYIGQERKSNSRNVVIKKSRNEQVLPFTNRITRQIRFPKPSSDNNVAKQESLADDNPLALLDNKYNPTKKTAKSSQLQQYQVKTNYLHSKRNRFMFPSNTRLLTVSDYQSIFLKLWGLVSYEAQHVRRVASILLLAMITGRSIHTVITEMDTNISERKFLVKDSGETVIKNIINVTVNRIDEAKILTKSKGKTLILPLPESLQAVLRCKFEVEQNDVNQLLKALKDHLFLSFLSSQHIESALAYVITHHIGEPLHSDIITGVEVEHSSPLYYTSIETSSLLHTYQAAIKTLSGRCFRDLRSVRYYKVNYNQAASGYLNPKCYQLWHAHKNPYFVNMPIIASNVNKTFIGSEMALTDKVCGNFFALLARKVQGDRQQLSHGTNASEDEYIKQFNAYGLWLWHVIQIQTGIRPVNDAPGFLNQFNFSHDMYWVSDKSIRQGKDYGRLIPLSDFLKKALKNYISYIKHFASVHNPLYPDHKLEINKILQSEVPFLQVFSLNPKKFMPITPKRIRNTVGKALPHKDNWLRHQLRSMLTNEVDEVYVCALLGHEHADQEIFHPMSSLSINQYRAKLLPHLDRVAQKLDLKQVEIKHG